MMVTLDEATSVVGISTLAIFRMVETGQVHFVETGEGLLRLCLPSLLAAVDELCTKEGVMKCE